jgi:hypothetical protein
MILMICGTGTPSACETSLTVAPELIVTGPLGAAVGCSRRGFAGAWFSRC